MIEQYKISKRISEKTKIEETRIKLATRSVFEFLKQQIESGERRSVRIPKCGLFSCKPQRVSHLKRIGLLTDNKKR